MNWKEINPQTRLYLIGAITLMAGLAAAAVIYVTAGSAEDSTTVYGFEYSKRYIHDLEVYGGKMNVIMDQFLRWFDGLWHGRSLAVTVACISVFASLVIFLVAYHMSPVRKDPEE